MKSRISAILITSSIGILSACASSTAQETAASNSDNNERHVWVSRNHGAQAPHIRMGKSMGHDIMDMDTDNDGKISKEEFSAHHAEKFDDMDANSDGFVEEQEVEEFVEAKVEAAMENFDFDFDFNMREFEEGMEEFEEEMEEFGEEMGRMGARMGNRMTRHRVRNHGDDDEHIEFYRSSEDIEVRMDEQKDKAMERLDKDGDGKVSRDEYPGPDRRFDHMDANNNGFVERDELKLRMRVSRQIGNMGHPEEEIIIIIDEDDEE